MLIVFFFCAGCRLSGSVFVPRLARRVATQSRGGGPWRTGTDHRCGHAAVAAARGPAVTVVATSRVRDHEAPGAGHQAHLVATGPDAGLQGAPAQNYSPVHGSRFGRVGRGLGDYLQPRTSPGPSDRRSRHRR